jgi:hypothetical protein
MLPLSFLLRQFRQEPPTRMTAAGGKRRYTRHIPGLLLRAGGMIRDFSQALLFRFWVVARTIFYKISGVHI